MGCVLGPLLFILYASKLFHVDYLSCYSYTAIASSSDGISESQFDSNQLLVFEMAHETQP